MALFLTYLSILLSLVWSTLCSLVSDVLLLPGLVLLPNERHSVGVVGCVPIHAVHCNEINVETDIFEKCEFGNIFFS